MQTKEQLTKIFRRVFSDDNIEISPEMTSGDIAAWDSLSHMIMIAEVEHAFGIRFSLREVNKLKNVGVLINLIDSKCSVPVA